MPVVFRRRVSLWMLWMIDWRCSCDISGRSRQVGGRTDGSQRGAQFVDEFGDQVGLVEQARILNCHCRLGSQYLQQVFVIIA